MDRNIKTLITAGILILFFIIAVKILLFITVKVIAILIPAAIVIIAGYVVYRAFFKR